MHLGEYLFQMNTGETIKKLDHFGNTRPAVIKLNW